MFGVDEVDDSIHPKSVVFGFDIGGAPVAYAEALLQENNSYSHEFAGATHDVTLHADGTVTLRRDRITYTPIRLYWFAWYTFNPQTELIN